MNVDTLFVRADELSSIDRPSQFAECESAVLDSLAAKSEKKLNMSRTC